MNGPNGYWCRYCGTYQSARDRTETRRARTHARAHADAGHVPTPHEGPFVPVNAAQTVGSPA